MSSFCGPAGNRGLVRGIFACFSCVVMILTAFQVVATSTEGRPDVGAGEDVSLDEGEVPATDTNGARPSVPVYGDIGVGSVEGYGSPPPPTIADAGTISRASVTSQNGLTLYRSSSGIYAIDRSRPAHMALLDFDGTSLVRESYFGLKASSSYLVPVNGEVV